MEVKNASNDRGKSSYRKCFEIHIDCDIYKYCYYININTLF